MIWKEVYVQYYRWTKVTFGGSFWVILSLSFTDFELSHIEHVVGYGINLIPIFENLKSIVSFSFLHTHNRQGLPTTRCWPRLHNKIYRRHALFFRKPLSPSIAKAAEHLMQLQDRIEAWKPGGGAGNYQQAF